MTEPQACMIHRTNPRTLDDGCLSCGRSDVFCAANRDHNGEATGCPMCGDWPWRCGCSLSRTHTRADGVEHTASCPA